MELGKKIASLRKSKNITQAQLAEYLSVNPQTVSRWEAEGGTPDVMLLPKISSFFGVSLDELFGMTDMEQVNHLVYKYSVLRDEKSFEEVMRSMELALDSLQEELEDTKENQEEILWNMQQIKAWKVHIYIQKSRGALEKAEQELDELRKEITPESPLYLPLKLQKQQFRIQMGDTVRILKETKEAWEKAPSFESIYTHMAALYEVQRSAEILQLWEMVEVQNYVSDVTTENNALWRMMFDSAVMEQNLEFFEMYFAKFKQYASEQGIFEVRCLQAELYGTFDIEKKDKLKEELLCTLQDLNYDPYFKEMYRTKIQLL